MTHDNCVHTWRVRNVANSHEWVWAVFSCSDCGKERQRRLSASSLIEHREEAQGADEIDRLRRALRHIGAYPDEWTDEATILNIRDYARQVLGVIPDAGDAASDAERGF